MLCLFGSSLIGQAFFVAPDPEGKLPACCRRDGKHHCGAAKDEREHRHKNQPAVQGARPRCAEFPGAIASPSSLAVMVAAPGVSVSTVTQPATEAEAETQYRVSLARAWQKRGPPSFLS